MFLEKDSQIDGLISKLSRASVVAVDTETTGLVWKKDKIVGMSVADSTKEGVFFMLPKAKLRAKLGKALSNEKQVKVFHNLKFDKHFLSECGIHVRGLLYDTYVLARLYDENMEKGGYKLKTLVSRLIDSTAAESLDALKTWLEKEGKTMAQLSSAPKALLSTYGANDAKITLQLYEFLRQKLKEDGIPDSLIEQERKVQHIAFLMEERGIKVDVPFLSRYKKQLEEQQTVLYSKLQKIVGKDFNTDSPDQVAEVAQSLGWEPKKTTATGKPQVDKYAMMAWKHPFSEAYLEYTRLGTIKGTFVDGILERQIDGLIHAEFDSAGTVTGRFSCRNPNLQNLDNKSEARKAFVPHKGEEFWGFDLKQIEPTVAAYFIPSPKLKNVFIEGRDFHRFNASLIYQVPMEKVTDEQRKKAKTLGLAILYNAGVGRIASALGVSDPEAKRIKKQVLDAIPSLKEYQKKCEKEIKDRAYAAARAAGRLKTSPGGWLYDDKPLPVKKYPNGEGGFWEFPDEDGITERGWMQNPYGRKRRLTCREAYNSVNVRCQGTSADLLKAMMVKIYEELGLFPLLQVHDEIVFSLPVKSGKEIAKKIKAIMEDNTLLPGNTEIPIRVDVAHSAKSFGEMEEL
jgi:DNA polymerase I